jgi:SanA protein
MRRLLRRALLLALVPVALVAAANAWVLLAARGDTAASLQRVPHAQVALVLGAQVMPNGSPSSMLEDRILTARDLYRAGRVDKLLLSGDHGRWRYDEVGTMRRRLLEEGVPARDLFTDHAGFDTWDSAQRARRVFGVDSAVVVTQRFHMARAVFAAERAGLQVTGFAADRRGYGRVMPRLRVRETLARVKVLGDRLTGAEPRFLGPRIPIAGDGRVTWGPTRPRPDDPS